MLAAMSRPQTRAPHQRRLRPPATVTAAGLLDLLYGAAGLWFGIALLSMDDMGRWAERPEWLRRNLRAIDTELTVIAWVLILTALAAVALGLQLVRSSAKARTAQRFNASVALAAGVFPMWLFGVSWTMGLVAALNVAILLMIESPSARSWWRTRGGPPPLDTAPSNPS